jgi:cobalt-zinc-cadmium efflux system protein
VSHHHEHNHPHVLPSKTLSKYFLLGIVFNAVFVVVEFTFGFLSNSLSLLADAWHNLGDVLGLAISLLAFRMAEKKPNDTFTYGLSKGTILASLANCVLLLLAIGTIGYEATERFFHPVIPKGYTMSLVAGLGVVINAATAFLFFRQSELNSRAAFLHMAADTLVSIGVVFAGILIQTTQLPWIDSVTSLIICLVILRGTWTLLKSSLKLSLDGVPENVNIQAIRDLAEKQKDVVDIHHIHVWAMSTTKNALTAHLTVKSMGEEERQILRKNIRHELLHLNIHHVTLELELQHTNDCEEC